MAKQQKLAIQPLSQIGAYTAAVAAVCLLCIVANIVSQAVMTNWLEDTIDMQNEALAATLAIIKMLNDTVTVDTPTWQDELQMGVFVNKTVQTIEGPANEIIVNRGTTNNDVPASVTMFELGNLDTNTTGVVDTGLGIFRIAGGEVIDCCAEAFNGCDCIWDRSQLPHSCCGNITQLNITAACGLALDPSQTLYVSNVAPSADETNPNGDLIINNLATVATGRVSYDGGRQIPVAFSEYMIASNVSRRWSMGEVAPCGYPLQGTSNENPCTYGGIRYPVDVISVYQGVSNGCQKNADPFLKKDIAPSYQWCHGGSLQPPSTPMICPYVKPGETTPMSCPGYGSDSGQSQTQLPYTCLFESQAQGSDQYRFQLCPDYWCPGSNGCSLGCCGFKTPPNPGGNSVSDVPTKPNSAIMDAQLYGSQLLTSNNNVPNSANCWSNCSTDVITPNPYVLMSDTGSLCQVDSDGQPTPNCPVNQLANLLATCASLDAPSNKFYTSATPGQACGKAPLLPPKTTTAAQIFDPARTYATTPKFPLVDGSVYEVRFGGTPMNFRPSSSLSNSPAQTDGVCSTFNVVTISNDACGAQSCDFYQYHVEYCSRGCIQGEDSNTYNNPYEERARLSQNSPALAVQMYIVCAAVPSEDDLMGYNPTVFELMDNNVPYVYDFSSLAQTHQLDGKSYYYINMTKLDAWNSALGLSSSDWMGQCGLFLSATPLMLTTAQQKKFRTFGIDGNDNWNPQDIEPCLENNLNNQCTSSSGGYSTASNYQTCPPMSPINPKYENNNWGQGFSGCCRPDAGQPMGFNHFCQPTNFTMLNSYLEVYTKLPGQTLDPPPSPPSCS